MWRVVSGESVSLHDPPSHIHQLQFAYKIKIIENVHRWAKKKRNYMSTIFLQQILNDKLLLVVIVGAKK